MAQLVEQRIRNAQVAGSSPATSSSRGVPLHQIRLLQVCRGRIFLFDSRAQHLCGLLVSGLRKLKPAVTLSFGSIIVFKRRHYAVRVSTLSHIQPEPLGCTGYHPFNKTL